MPRAYPSSDYADSVRNPDSGEWQALRGELVALLDKVESRYQTDEQAEPAMDGLAQRVRNLRDQVEGPETNTRHREALKTVKRAVDRFSDRDAAAPLAHDDDLTAALAEIRSRQGAQPAAMRRQAMPNPELRELGALVGGMSQRLERLESDLHTRRTDNGQVREVASQVEQLTQVVELLAGAVGETGQVKRLESQIAALGAMIEEGPRSDLAVINARLDDVAATVGKLAELQAAQMEREIDREERRASEAPGADTAVVLTPAMNTIEKSVRNVYDRIDAIEKAVALSSGDFEKLTQDMAAFTKAVEGGQAAPAALAGQVEALVARLDKADDGHADVAALKAEMVSLRGAVLQGLEPRFQQLEGQIAALSDRIVPVDTSRVESQLKLLMQRMDDAGAQLDGLARLYASEEKPDFDSLAAMVAERTSDAISRKAPAPVAMFGPDSLKSIEDRITGLIKSAGKTPDYEQLAEIVATRTSEAVAKAKPETGGDVTESMTAMEKRMTALFNTAGKETAERLTRLEATLASKAVERASVPPQSPVVAPAPSATAMPAPLPATPMAEKPIETADAFAEALKPNTPDTGKLDAILAGLSKDGRDAMPKNPADEAPLVDPGFKNVPQRPIATPAAAAALVRPAAVAADAPLFDPDTVERPPRPRSSFADLDTDPFAEPTRAPAETVVAPPASTSTSTFVAAARRAQRSKQDAVAEENQSIFGRALARVRPAKTAEAEPQAAVVVPPPAETGKPARPEKLKAEKIKAEKAKTEKVKAEKPAPAPKPERRAAAVTLPDVEGADRPSFLVRHRRPLLLAATLVAVSMLALNLVLQRMASEETPAAQAVAPAATPAPAAEPAAPANPAPSNDQSSVVPPRVIDLVDPTSTASINPGAPMSFSRASEMAQATALPPPITAKNDTLALASAVPASAAAAPQTAGSIAAPAVAPKPETFDLPPEAVGPKELRQAAANGDAKAQFEIGAIYGEGRAVKKDDAESARWYERSAAQGFVPAEYRLGNLYEAGTGVEKDLKQAQLWYQRAAEAGNRMAMHNLAALNAGGSLGTPDFNTASEWFARAAALGMTDSQFNLGMLYARGLGVEQDFEQSYKWFSLAASTGDKDATQARDDIAKTLSADAVAKVNAEVKDWKVAQIDLAANFAPIGTWAKGFDPGQAISSREVVSKVQLALAKLGFDIGTPDGVAGPKTAEAIKTFESATGMSPSGAVNPRLLAVLGSQPV